MSNVLEAATKAENSKEQDLPLKEEIQHEIEEKNSQSLEKDCDDYIKDVLEEGNISDCFE